MAKILVVDDEPDLELLLRQKFRRQIRKGTLTLVFAQNGVEALKQLEAHDDVDMVLSDINMPQMDGLTLLNQLNELNRDLRAVIVTAYGDMKNIRTAMNRGAFDFITKPIDFKDLEATIAKTLAHLEVMREALRSRDELVAIRRELGVAARMQESILPTDFPSDTRYEIHAAMTPALEVGGDFYDFFNLEDGRMGIVMADVSGKGVPAALFMMVSRTLMKGTAIGEPDPTKALAEVNQLLVESNEEAMFVTLFYASFDPSSGRLMFANGGHNLPYVIRQNGEVQQIDCESGVVLAVLPGFDFPGGSLDLEPGDAIFFYTDGITEAMNEVGEEFGDDALAEVLAEVAGSDAASFSDRVVAAVREHAGEADQSDDITCLCLRYANRSS
ncbi:MAG: SpoIIE family protein phosphatase [Gemmatimonadota bacterium]|nr:SpoIIE family protein phosphatase [Gemmatimonadota bacterium]MDE2865099.1 SpoIIE family protein phosphatase [Gemmatimonadota bacterium]